MNQHEKAKQYTSLLQRYLSLVKQGELETNTLTLSLPQPSLSTDTPEAQAVPSADKGDEMFKEILNNVPSRSKKNAQYILEKMVSSWDIASWSKTGEFVFNGVVIPGSHVFDLVSNVKVSQLHRW